MSWETTDVLLADATHVLSAQTTTVLSADKSGGLSADTVHEYLVTIWTHGSFLFVESLEMDLSGKRPVAPLPAEGL